MSCGHRSCNRCQNTDASEWLERQRQKLLPVEYFMVTFTLPAQLRQLAWQNQTTVYDLLFTEAGLLTAKLKKSLPKTWVVNCQHTGKGEPALKYLSRYLYRGVISDRQMVASQNGKVTFTYRNSESGTTESRTLQGEDFLWLVLQHVLPKGLRRVRDYGFLHCRCRKLLRLVQLILQVIIKPATPVIRPKHSCQYCGSDMRAIAFRLMRPS